MVPVIVKPPISARQKAAAMAVAGVVDLLQVVVFPVLGIGYLFDDVLDVFAAVALTAICGFKWQFVLAFMLELVPVMDLFPTWTAVVLMMPTHGREGVRVVTDSGEIEGNEGRGPVDVEAVVVDREPERRET